MTTRDTESPAVDHFVDELPEVRSDMSHQLRATWVVTRRELLRFKQDKARMVTMLLQPLLFIFVMGVGLGTIVDTGGGTSFSTFLFPGVLATSVLFTAAFAGISLVWDREFGFLREMMVAPISRGLDHLGQVSRRGDRRDRAEPDPAAARRDRRHPLRHRAAARTWSGACSSARCCSRPWACCCRPGSRPSRPRCR